MPDLRPANPYRNNEPLLLPHLLKCISNVECANFLIILELKKLVAPMPGHVHEDVRPIIGQKALRARHRRIHASYRSSTIVPSIRGNRNMKMSCTCKYPQEILNGNFITAVVHLDIVSVQIKITALICIHATGKLIPRVTGCIVGQHKNDVRIRYTKSFDRAVPAENSNLRQLVSRSQTETSHIPSALAMC